MSTNAPHLPDAHDSHDEEIIQIVDDHHRGPRGGTTGWLISGGVHLSAIALMALAVSKLPPKGEVDVPPTRVTPIAMPEKQPEKLIEKRTVQDQEELKVPIESETQAPVSTVDVLQEPTDRETEHESTDPKGREEAVADAETGGASFFMALGAGGGGAGMLGKRLGDGQKRAVIEGGGNPASQSSVRASLRWFKRHQSPNGSWETDRYYQNCSEGAKCEPGGDVMGHGSDQNVAMTSYALLCFLGAGNTHTLPGQYRNTVKKGIEWLVAVQKNDGYFGLRNYEHPIATMALAEAYAMTADPALREPTQKAVDQILAHQNQDGGKAGYAGGLGWDYTKPTKRNDASVTGWNVMALKSALAGGLNVGKGMAGSKQWLEQSWKASNSARDGEFKSWQEITAYDKSHFAYCWTTGEPAVKENTTGRESMGLVCAIFLGHTAGDAMVESLANTVMATQLPKTFATANAYYLYYNTMAMFQVGGDKWTTWNGTVRDLLVNAQRKSTDCVDGSWDWSSNNFVGAESGRVLTTAYCTLSLEVYYRYDQIKNLHRK